MKNVLMLLLLSGMSYSAMGQTNQTSTYDSILAKRVGADKNGMRKYMMVILKTGPGDTVKGKTRSDLFAGHMANINKLADEGKLVLAGPFAKNTQSYRGIFILDAKTVEEARTLCETDPTVKAKVFEVDVIEWYGSAAVMEMNNIHKRLEKPAN